MIESLVPHPDHPPHMVRDVTVEWHPSDERPDGDAPGNRLVKFVVHGASALVLPEARPPVRTNDLWQNSCFELFFSFGRGRGYAEYNFSPSGAWAAYAFDGYRSGMRDLEFLPPAISGTRIGDRYELRVKMDTSINPAANYPFLHTAVIEENGGVKSFWAATHPPGPPDFHHAACFPT